MPRRMDRNKLNNDLAYHLDRTLLKILREGEMCFDPQTGKPMLDDDGKPVRKEPSAAMLGQIRQRLKDCGITTALALASNPHDGVVEGIREAERRGAITLPDPDDEDEREEAESATETEADEGPPTRETHGSHDGTAREPSPPETDEETVARLHRENAEIRRRLAERQQEAGTDG